MAASQANYSFTFVGGTFAVASQVNDNLGSVNTALLAINDENFGTFSGAQTVIWSISNSNDAMSVSNSSAGAGSIIGSSYSGNLAANTAMVDLNSSGSNTAAGSSGLGVDFSNAASTQPLVRLTSVGSGALIEGVQDQSVPFFNFSDTAELRFRSLFDSINGHIILEAVGVSNRLAFLSGDGKYQFGTVANSPTVSPIPDAAPIVEVNDRLRLKDNNGPILSKGAGTGKILDVEDRLRLGTSATGAYFVANNDKRILLSTGDTESSQFIATSGGSGNPTHLVSGLNTLTVTTPVFVPFGYTFGTPPSVVVTATPGPASAWLTVPTTTTGFTVQASSLGQSVYWHAHGTRGD